MTRLLAIYGISSAAVVAIACGPKVLVPPRVDLEPFPNVGLATFSIENAKGDLNEMATQQFLSELFNAQPDVRVIEIGPLERLIEEAGRERLDREVLRLVAAEYDVPVIFTGHMTVSNVTPEASLYRFPSVAAVVSVQLTVRMLEAESGATLWSRSARATEGVGEVGVTGGEIVFSAQHPDEAYGHLVQHLVVEITHDLRPTYR
jgi:hypothetical protein